MAHIEQHLADLQSPDVSVRSRAAESLCLAGQAAADGATALVQACGDPAEAVQTWAVAALEDLGTPPLTQLSELQSLITAPDPLVAYWAITLCGRLELEAKRCEPELIQMLSSSSDTAVRERAAWALGKIQTTAPEGLAALRRATESGSPRLARVAQTAGNEAEN